MNMPFEGRSARDNAILIGSHHLQCSDNYGPTAAAAAVLNTASFGSIIAKENLDSWKGWLKKTEFTYSIQHYLQKTLESTD